MSVFPGREGGMKDFAAAKYPFYNNRGSVKINTEYYSVEFCVEELDCSYQFKLWQTASGSMQITIRHDSAILKMLEPGKKFNIKYYSNERSCPASYHETLIKQVSKVDEGRFRGHYLVDLCMIENAGEISFKKSAISHENLWISSAER
jgi:hypothetical protein